MFRKHLIVLILLFAAAGVHASTHDARLIQSMRIQSFGFCVAMMVNYNHIRTPFQHRSTDSYRQYLDALNALYRQSGLTMGAEYLKALNDLTEELENLPQPDGVMSTTTLVYPVAITNIFKAQQQFDQALTRYHAMVDQGDEGIVRTIDDLRLDISRIMLLYSVSTFTGLAYLNVEDPDLSILDGRIYERFQVLEQQAPEWGKEIEKIKNLYRFVQPKLVGLPRPWTPSAVELFLTRAGDALADLASRREE